MAGEGHAAHGGSPLAEEHGSWVHPLAHAIGVPDWIVVSWIVIALLAIFAFKAKKRLDMFPVGWQNAGEFVVETMENYLRVIMGEHGAKYAPLIGALFLYIFALSLIGIVPGMLAPTAKLSTTLALAICTFFCVQGIAIKELGLGGYLKHLCGEPLWMAPLQFPLHVIGELAKPLSLAIRLFGNIFGEDTIVLQLVILATALPKWLPLPIQLPLLAFSIFGSFVQALVFSTLAAVYIAVLTTGHDDAHGHADEHHAAPAAHAA